MKKTDCGIIILLSVAILLLASCSATRNSSGKNYKHNVEVSYYADRFNGNKTASGEKFNNNKYTAAHRTLPFGTKIKVTNVANHESVIVEINDRGPHTRNRELDLSKRAFMEITDNKNNGVIRADIQILN